MQVPQQGMLDRLDILAVQVLSSDTLDHLVILDRPDTSAVQVLLLDILDHSVTLEVRDMDIQVVKVLSGI